MKPRVFDVLVRRMVEVKAAAEAAWAEWRANLADVSLLHRYARLSKRYNRLRAAAIMDLDERTQATLNAWNGGL